MTARWRWLKLAPFVGSAVTTARPLLKVCVCGQAKTAIIVKHKF